MTITNAPEIGRYTNGDTSVTLYADGTKVRQFPDEGGANPLFPESIDLKITNYCDAGCAWCHEGSTLRGKHANLNLAFLSTLRPATEIAIGGGNPLDHPRLEQFLVWLNEHGIIANLTVNEIHWPQACKRLMRWKDEDLVKGIGISCNIPSSELVNWLSKTPGTVAHVIFGVTPPNVLEWLADAKVSILVLGYKHVRRGIRYDRGQLGKHQLATLEVLRDRLFDFKTVSFDNLALAQIPVRQWVAAETWDERYLGEDGQHTMYIDAVERAYAISSTSGFRFPLLPTIDEMFANVRQLTKERV